MSKYPRAHCSARARARREKSTAGAAHSNHNKADMHTPEFGATRKRMRPRKTRSRSTPQLRRVRPYVGDLQSTAGETALASRVKPPVDMSAHHHRKPSALMASANGGAPITPEYRPFLPCWSLQIAHRPFLHQRPCQKRAAWNCRRSGRGSGS